MTGERPTQLPILLVRKTEQLKILEPSRDQSLQSLHDQRFENGIGSSLDRPSPNFSRSNTEESEHQILDFTPHNENNDTHMIASVQNHIERLLPKMLSKDDDVSMQQAAIYFVFNTPNTRRYNMAILSYGILFVQILVAYAIYVGGYFFLKYLS